MTLTGVARNALIRVLSLKELQPDRYTVAGGGLLRYYTIGRRPEHICSSSVSPTNYDRYSQEYQQYYYRNPYSSWHD